MSSDFIGELEHMVLASILRLGDDAYGLKVGEELARVTSRRVSSGALYTTLDRLEKKGLLKSREADASPARGGRPRKYYRLTPAGTTSVRRSRQAMLALWRGLERSLDKS